jgi:hypothetical protein
LIEFSIRVNGDIADAQGGADKQLRKRRLRGRGRRLRRWFRATVGGRRDVLITVNRVENRFVTAYG